MGWSCIQPRDNYSFAKWVKSYIIDHWSFDGIDIDVIPMINNVLDYGSTMEYGNSYDDLIDTYLQYKDQGLKDDQLMIGVQAGPKQCGFTSLNTTKQVVKWQPENRTKKGIMLFSFSQDIQEFTH